MNTTEISVIIPFFNEANNLAKLHQELISVLNKLDKNCEIIYVDDGSTDESIKQLKSAIKKNKSKKIKTYLVSLGRNLGQTASTAAGIDTAKGKIIAFLDADLQNDPHDLMMMLKKLDQGYDAVFGWRKQRSDDFLRNFLSSFANEMYEICKKLGANWYKVWEGWTLDPRVERSHSAVFPKNRGFSGKCLPKDMAALIKVSQKHNYQPKFLQEVVKSNNRFRKQKR